MADKNRNGIDDRYEVSYGRRSPGDRTSPSVATQSRPDGIGGAWQDFLQGPVRGLSNFIGDLGLDLMSRPRVKGQSAGDQMFGVPARRPAPGSRTRPTGGGGSFEPPVPPPGDGAPTTPPLSLLDFLSQASGIVDQLGIGQGGGGPDYSGAIDSARSQALANRQHIANLYGQLRQGLEQDRGSIAQNYGGAIDRSQDIAEQAQSVTRDAYNAAQARQDQAVQALGMQQAAASQELDRPTTQQQAADAVADSAARAQNAQTMYNSQQANATTHSQNVQNASRFSETRAQGALDQSLADRIAELEQMQAQAASQGGGERQSAILSLAQQLYSDTTNASQQDFENQLNFAKTLNDSREGQEPTRGFTLEQLMRGQQESGLNTQDYMAFMKLLSQLNG